MDYSKWNLIPKNIGKEGISCFGKQEVNLKGFKIEFKGGFTNILFTEESDFEDFVVFKYLDGFSPNLNKKLHIGHFSNLANAKAFSNLGVAEKIVAIYGDTLDNTNYENKNYSNFGYRVDKEYYASEVKLKNESILLEGEGDYLGTKVFKIGDKYQVGVKSNGKTSYFYQDIALIQELDGKTLYLTGFEQNEHFKLLNEFSPNVVHIGLGLVTLEGSKMSSREGNVIFMEDFVKEIDENFNNLEISYNVAASFILRTNPKTKKNINMAIIGDLKQSLGLYISYSTARLSNLPINFKYSKPSIKTKFLYLKAKYTLNPAILFNHLYTLCNEFNSDYHNLKSTGNEQLYNNHYSDIRFCLEKLGLFWIGKI